MKLKEETDEASDNKITANSIADSDDDTLSANPSGEIECSALPRSVLDARGISIIQEWADRPY